MTSSAEAVVRLVLVWNQKLNKTSYITSFNFERINWIFKALILDSTVVLKMSNVCCANVMWTNFKVKAVTNKSLSLEPTV